MSFRRGIHRKVDTSRLSPVMPDVTHPPAESCVVLTRLSEGRVGAPATRDPGAIPGLSARITRDSPQGES